MSVVTWELASDDIETRLGSLGQRAKKRSGIQLSPTLFMVNGDPKLSDSYDHYEVKLNGTAYHCECQDHGYGEYRRLCSHIAYIVMARKGVVDWAAPATTAPKPPKPPTFQDLPEAPLPLFVDQGQEWTEGVREALDAHFGGGYEIKIKTYTVIDLDGELHEIEGDYRQSSEECCFCHRPLTDPVSVSSGYGPDCARNYGLPHKYGGKWTVIHKKVKVPSAVPPLPSWVKFIRPHQWDAYAEVLSHFDSGIKVVFLSAPTGSGKTLLAEMVRRSMRARTAYVCTTKTLQNQVERDFPYAAVIKGRANYPTLNHPETPWLACDLCEKKKFDDPCRYCDNTEECPYAVARFAASVSDLAVANTAYLLAEGNSPHSILSGRELIIADEADSLEDELMRHIEIGLSPRLMKQLKITPPGKATHWDSRQKWVDEVALPAIRLRIGQIGGDKDPKKVREKRRLKRLVDQMDDLHFDDDWVYTGFDKGWATFKPIKVTDQAQGYLWYLGKQWLLMSATIISAQQMAEDLGLDDHEWAVVDVPSTFPVENRPIYVEPVANMTAKTKETAWPVALERIQQIASHHDERILVHTVSYALADYFTENLGPRAITYRAAKEREGALDRFLASDNSILLAPSFERGIDLPYNDCRVIVVAKVPFPYLGDKQVSKRLRSQGGNGWYSMVTVRSLIQMTGRAMRHEDDTCSVYIIDRQFIDNIWRKKKHLIPDWWKEALVMSGSPNLKAARRGEVAKERDH